MPDTEPGLAEELLDAAAQVEHSLLNTYPAAVVLASDVDQTMAAATAPPATRFAPH